MMTITSTYRPAAPHASILDEIVCGDELQRFKACEAVCASIWAAGLNSCASVIERQSWQARYAHYLLKLSRLWIQQTTPRP